MDELDGDLSRASARESSLARSYAALGAQAINLPVSGQRTGGLPEKIRELRSRS